MLGPTTWPVEKRGSSTVNRLGIPHYLDAEIATRHQPATERRNPRDRLGLTEAGQETDTFPAELLESERCPERVPSGRDAGRQFVWTRHGAHSTAARRTVAQETSTFA